MALSKKPTGKKKSLRVDMSGVESGGRNLPDGSYEFEIIESVVKESAEGNQYISLKTKVASGSHKGATVYDNLSLLPQALWKLRSLLEALGYDIPDGEMDLDPSDLVGEKFHAEVTNEKYEGKDRPRISGYLHDSSTSEEEEDETEEEEETEAEEEEEETETEEETEEEEEEEAPPPTSKKKTTAAKPATTSKFKPGMKVKFKDDKGKTVKATVMSVSGSSVTVEDSKGEEWEVDASELEAA